MARVDTWQEMTLLLDPSWTKPVGWERKKKKEKEGRRSRERSSTFSLDFPVIELSVSVGARGKVFPCDKSFE